MWPMAVILLVYSLYYDWTTTNLIAASIQMSCFVAAVAATFRWVHLVKKKHRVAKFSVNILTLEEFTFFLYWIPTLVYAPLPTLWSIITGDIHWKSHTVEYLIFIMVCHVFSGCVIIGNVVRLPSYKCSCVR